MTRRPEIDDATLLRLLWHPDRPTGPRPGPRARLTLTAVVQAGIALADDRDGPALSMRLVAERLGSTPMALYSYVDGKDTLLRLMSDTTDAADARPDEVEPSVQTWAAALTDLYVRHPWLTEVSWSRPVLGPHEQAVLEDLLRRLRPLDLTPTEDGTIASTLLALGRSTGRLIADARQAARTGPSDEQWWQAQSAATAEHVPDLAERFPLSARTTSPAPAPEDDPAHGYVERAARAQLCAAVRLVLRGATAGHDPA
jgi:AcrR family transcriptional regulator